MELKTNSIYCRTILVINPSCLEKCFIEFENIKNGKWQTTIGRTLHGKTLGIFGLGKQGKQVAKFGHAFGMNVIAWSHNLNKRNVIKKM